MIPVHPRRIFMARGITDMRKQFDTLASLVRSRVGEDPLSGDAFVFVGRRRNRLKVLLWDGSGFWLLVKRLERGSFAVPAVALSGDEGAVVVSEIEWRLLLSGIEILSFRQRRRYQRAAARATASDVNHASPVC
jgi:transposase